MLARGSRTLSTECRLKERAGLCVFFPLWGRAEKKAAINLNPTTSPHFTETFPVNEYAIGPFSFLDGFFSCVAVTLYKAIHHEGKDHSGVGTGDRLQVVLPSVYFFSNR